MMVLQFANGGNLRDYLNRKQDQGIFKISWIELTRIAKDMTLGLKYLHTKDIIHRDLVSFKFLYFNLYEISRFYIIITFLAF